VEPDRTFLAARLSARGARDGGLLVLCHLLFYGLVLGIGAVVYRTPDVIYSSWTSVGQQYEDMYDPDGGLRDRGRSADSDARMFASTIWNNVSIAFRTFASGWRSGGDILSLVVQRFAFGWSRRI